MEVTETIIRAMNIPCTGGGSRGDLEPKLSISHDIYYDIHFMKDVTIFWWVTHVLGGEGNEGEKR